VEDGFYDGIYSFVQDMNEDMRECDVARRQVKNVSNPREMDIKTRCEKRS
jgi:hypothetical protein